MTRAKAEWSVYSVRKKEEQTSRVNEQDLSTLVHRALGIEDPSISFRRVGKANGQATHATLASVCYLVPLKGLIRLTR